MANNNNDGDEGYLDEAFERHIQDSVVWVGDGHHFIDPSWVNLGASAPIQPDPERPLVLHTCLRHEEGNPMAGYSYAHDRHPYVAFIYIVLGPKEWNVETLAKFVGRSKSREEAVRRLHIKRYGHDTHWSTATYSHSKAMISSAGAIIGSYNLTGAARLRHMEHSVLLGPESNIEGLRNEFRQLWGNIKTQEIKISRTPTPTKHAPPAAGNVHNPYAKKQKK